MRDGYHHWPANWHAASSCIGKATFDTAERAAKVAKRRRKAKTGKARRSECYRCPHCRGWHIGSRDV